MCLYCLNLSYAANARGAFSRRDILRRATALGVALPVTAASNAIFAAEQSDPAPADFKKGVEDLIARAHSPELAGYRLFQINGPDLPWIDLGLEAVKGQQITFLVTGRWWLSRQHDLWFRPGLGFHARTRGKRPIYSPGVDTGAMTALHDGPIEVARLATLGADEDGRLTIPEDVYARDDVTITGVALLWRGEAATGLASLAAHGDVDGLLAVELARLRRNRRLPEGWSDLFLFGGGEESFIRDANGEIVCESAGGASIIERPLSLPLASRPKLGWRWKIDQLPSAVPEDQAPVHDYLSIGVKFEDGQDLTYIWSAALPTGKVFRCPLPGWNAVETHMIVDSGATGLGSWRERERDVASDYAAHIGGPAKAISHIWLLAITPFQRRRGACRYADIRVETADGVAHTL
ncbi:DUF3047 domain-containing protein [Methylocystis sp. MJC1]|jgi:hypothetical protein|uniref:DUF3047 domain-containing protein n=1 Tax=Methylocystis sp. MJC1 TaxID=2654282 RepID=UPI0013EB89A7|nr:DUF3047 domain-containing protein [Methylocystis sp. MJC1]KAF2992131.1 hypothetical protein MJC1_00503 [Methylocystis sp. MJC1]MBU6527272.1 DUF3047 domain-containing protein [Methylocystis sp. MJC1]UZX10229.1 DUF3047 domain-containing protein [Methylocystis sp. MJC1]